MMPRCLRALVLLTILAAVSAGEAAAPGADLPPGEPGRDYTPIIVPNGSILPWRVVDGVKVFHLVAQECRHTFAPGLTATVWGYNGQTPGPVIEISEGDHIRVYLTNRLPEPTTLHWHGLQIPNGQDGVAGLTEAGVAPGHTQRYEFTVHQHGTFLYHPHFDEMTQMAMGLQGMLIIHPRPPAPAPAVDRDFALLLSEWAIPPGASRPNPNEMTDFNILTLNGVVYPATAPLVAQVGDRVRIRFGNLGAMDHHPLHLHGHHFAIVATDGGDIPASAQWPETTVLVPVGTTRDIAFVADNPGDWPLHCHMTHHAMNQMGHGLPNVLGADLATVEEQLRILVPGFMAMGTTGMGEMNGMHMDVPANSIPMLGGDGPFGAIAMGGMFTLLKVRSHVASQQDPGWYAQPPGTGVAPATEAELRRDGISLEPPPAAHP